MASVAACKLASIVNTTEYAICIGWEQTTVPDSQPIQHSGLKVLYEPSLQMSI
jgi:hypothetical protein